MIISIQKDRFNEFFERSIIKYFNEVTTQNSNTEVFNEIYNAKFNADDINYADILNSFKGVIVLEKSLFQMEEKYLGGSFINNFAFTDTALLTADAQIAKKSIEIDDATDFNKNDYFCLGPDECRRIASKSGNTLFFNEPLNNDWVTGTEIQKISSIDEARGFVYAAELQLRLVTDTNQREGSTQRTGKKDLLNMQSFMLQILQNNEKIPFYDFDTDVTTSMNIQWDANLIQYVEIPKTYEQLQEGLFTIPIWCDIYESESGEIITETCIELDKRTR